MSLQVRPFEEPDRNAVIDLWQRCGLTRPWNDPSADIDLATRNPNAAILIGTINDSLTATIMTGFDGHRGWIYYLAIAPEHARNGHGRRMMAEAEQWLKQRGAPKAELMVRTENQSVIEFYRALGYDLQDVAVLGKWLKPSPQRRPHQAP
ncbi:MAG TPA: GNAT family acetyltransferase [Hyphomicrobiaceae bacterium]|nr:GNAT family acetyltransferase [Hyphomicrobiaceae bacterium]